MCTKVCIVPNSKHSVFLPPATKFGQRYVFTRVCDSVHRGRGVSGSVHAGIHPPGADNPPRSRHPPPVQRMLGDTGNKRAVRILLQCILVKI